MEIATTKCTQHRHPEFVLQVRHEYLRKSLQWVVNVIEEMVAAGSRFKPQQTFQIGMSMTMVQQYDASRLTLHEPDMVRFPIQWTPGITWTIEQLFLQTSCLQSVGLPPELRNVALDTSLIACSRYEEGGFLMDRAEPRDENDSGWFVGCRDEAHEHNDRHNLQRISLYEALLSKPEIGPFLTFPFQSMIAVEPDRGFQIFVDEKELEVPPGTFLHELLKRK